MQELYFILEVSPDATPQQIKRAYREKANKLHPDKAIGDDAAADQFAKAKDAYDVLIDPVRRKIYDAEGTVNTDPLFLEAVKKITESIVGIIYSTDDIESHNLLSVLQMNISTYLKSLEKTKQQTENIRRKYQKTAGKFIKRRGGFNIFSEAIVAQIGLLDKNIVDIQYKIDVAEKMQDILKEYEYQLLLYGGDYH